MIKPYQKMTIWIMWLLVVPFGTWFVYHNFPPNLLTIDLDIIGFLLMLLFVASTPIIINQTPVFYIQWVSLAVFLIYGLLAEIIFMQLAMLVLLIRIRIPKEQLHRYPLNSLMFFIVSLLSGLIYYAIGGAHNVLFAGNPLNVLLASTYALAYFLLNHLILSLIQFFLFRRRAGYFGRDFVWESITTVITLPFGLILYTLYNQLGVVALIIVGIPYASLAIILNMYQGSDKINYYLQKAMEIGHELAERLKVNEVIDLFLEKVIAMLPVDSAYILDVVDDQELHLLRGVENGETIERRMTPLKRNEGISGYVWSTKKAVLYYYKKEWQSISAEFMPKELESILCVPVIRSNNVVAVLLLASRQKRAFEKTQLMIVDILCSYFAVAIENAKHYTQTKEESEHCALTNLYNYRYIEKRLSEEFSLLRQNERECLSIILLDIDHFKAVNDTYGHQSGNEILCELASRLSALLDNIGTIARYGGEEFLILLPNTEKDAAFKTAELIRQMIANRPFTIFHHIESDHNPTTVNITVSIGVATAPEDADDEMTIIRHADRALYLGAKRAGRNRVAEYVR